MEAGNKRQRHVQEKNEIVKPTPVRSLFFYVFPTFLCYV
jgi:hypothetical protein